MDRLDSALKKIKKKKEMKEAAPLAAIAKGALVAAKGAAKGIAKGAKAGAKAGKTAIKKSSSIVKTTAKQGQKVINPDIVGGEAKKSAQLKKNTKPKEGPTIDVKATEVKDAKKETMASKSSTPKKGQSKGGEMQKSQSSDITNKGKSQVDPQKNPEADKPKDEPKKDVPKEKKKGKNPDVIGAASRAYGKTSFSVKEQKTFKEWLETLPVDQLDETMSAELGLDIPKK
jgi:hypothetical protein